MGPEYTDSMQTARPARAPKPLRFQIAGIPFAVRASSSQHRQWLRTAYKAFRTKRKPWVHLAIRTRSRSCFYVRNRERIVQDGGHWQLESQIFRIRELIPRKEYEAEIAAGPGIGDLMRAWFSGVLLSRGGILLHAAGVIRAGRALVFCGPTGSGKTTLARLAGSQPLLSDESIAITRRSGAHGSAKIYYAHGTPFFGELAAATVNRCAPIGEIFLLDAKRSPRTRGGCRLSSVRASQSMAQLVAQSFLRRPAANSLNILLPLLDELIQRVRVCRLEFDPTAEIWDFIDDTCR